MPVHPVYREIQRGIARQNSGENRPRGIPAPEPPPRERAFDAAPPGAQRGPGNPPQPAARPRRILLLLGVWTGLLLAGLASARAQLPMTTGTLDFVSPESGTLRIRSDQRGGRPVLFYGMNSANIMTEGGTLLTLEDLEPGMPVSIFFVNRGRRGWAVLKVVTHEPQARPEPAARPWDELGPPRVTGQIGNW